MGSYPVRSCQESEDRDERESTGSTGSREHGKPRRVRPWRGPQGPPMERCQRLEPERRYVQRDAARHAHHARAGQSGICPSVDRPGWRLALRPRQHRPDPRLRVRQ